MLGPEGYRQVCENVIKRDSWRCQWCGSMKNLQAHQIQARSRLGDDVAENLIALCATCHQEVHRQNM